MSLTFAERRRYLRDRALNAARMIRHGNFKLFRESLVFEINHVRNLFRMWRHSRRDAIGRVEGGSASDNRTRVLPASWRPTVLRRVPPPAVDGDVAELADELGRIRARLRPTEPARK
jgi:hypothetical protein